MRTAASCLAMTLVAIYCIAFGGAIVMGLAQHMHWVFALLAMSVVILARLWPALPALAYYGARTAWGWEWFIALPFILPVLGYIVPHYWMLISDRIMRPKLRREA